MKSSLPKHSLLIGIIAGAILGGRVGAVWPDIGVKFEIVGKLFLDALKMIVLPLIVVSITLSIMKVGNLGSLGLKTILYYTATTAIAVFIGIVVVTMMHPGEGSVIATGQMPEIVKVHRRPRRGAPRVQHAGRALRGGQGKSVDAAAAGHEEVPVSRGR